MEKQNKVKCKSVIRRETFQKTGKLPDCTNPHPTDEEIDYDDEFNKAISRYTCDEILEHFFFKAGYKAQSAKLKEQADEIKELKKLLNSSIREDIKANNDFNMLVKDKLNLSSLLSEAVELLEETNGMLPISTTDKTIRHFLKKLEQFTKG